MDNRRNAPGVFPDFDSEGFLRNPNQWSEQVASEIARKDGLAELTQSHWDVIHWLREHFERFGAAPPAFRHICHVNHLGPHGVENLFRTPREAWRVAGLPDPGEEARTYM
jgi:TusE/DsrC/DsvC family sulfur relay protein